MRSKSTQRIVFGIVGVLFFIFLIMRMNTLFGNMARSQTVKAKYVTVKDKITVSGITVRDEEYIYKNGQGHVIYYYRNGERLSANEEVAGLYADKSDVLRSQQISEMTREIESLTEFQSDAHQSGAYMETIVKDITGGVSTYVNSVENQQLDNIAQTKIKMTSLLNSRNVLTKKDIDFSPTIARLTYERDNLASSVSAISSGISVPSAGYFVNTIDGYENLTLEEVSAMYAQDLKNLIESPNRPISTNENMGTIGKVIKGYDWHFAAVVPNEELDRLSKGYKYNLSIVFDKSYNVVGEVVDIKTRQGENDSIVIFECNEMNSQLADMRIKSIDIVFREISGVAVPKSALRMPEGKTGVHVVLGETVVFKEISRIYETDDYYISKVKDTPTEEEPNLPKTYLQINDRIIVPGNE